MTRREENARRDAWALAAAWIGASLVRLALGACIPTPQIVTDEIRFIGIAHDVASGDLRGLFSTFAQYPFGLYPTLLAPLFRWLPEQGYAGAKIVNALLMSSACFPAWLLARRVLPRDAARTVGLLTLCLPALGYASNVIAENLFTPLSLLTFELGLRWRSTRRARFGFGLALAGGGLLCTKAQGAYLLAALAALPLLPAFGGSRRARATWLLELGAAGLGSVSVAVAWAYVRLGPALWGHFFEPFTWLGYYVQYLGSPAHRQRNREALLWLANWLSSGSELLPMVGVVAFAAAAAATWHGRRRAARLLGSLCLLLWVLFTRDGVHLGVYFDGGLIVHERYTSELAPLLLLLAAEWLQRRGPGALRAPVALAAVAGGAGAVVLLTRVRSDHLVNDSPALSWLLAVPAPAATWIFLAVGLLATGWLLVCAARPRWLWGGIALSMALTSLGMARSQRALALTDHDRKMQLVPFAQKLARSGQPVFFLIDERDIWPTWMAEAFTGEGEGKAYCLKSSQGLCNDAGLTSAGRLSGLEKLPRGSLLLVSDETIDVSSPLVAAEPPYKAYLLTGEPLWLLSGARSTMSPP